MADAPGKAKRIQAGRGAVLGVILGTGGGCLFLFYEAMVTRFGKVDCAGMLPTECDVWHQTRFEMASTEGQFAILLGILAFGFALLHRWISKKVPA